MTCSEDCPSSRPFVRQSLPSRIWLTEEAWVICKEQQGFSFIILVGGQGANDWAWITRQCGIQGRKKPNQLPKEGRRGTRWKVLGKKPNNDLRITHVYKYRVFKRWDNQKDGNRKEGRESLTGFHWLWGRVTWRSLQNPKPIKCLQRKWSFLPLLVLPQKQKVKKKKKKKR